MKEHPAQEQFVLHYYGESTGGVEEHLSECEACREEYCALQRVLNAAGTYAAPERGADYEERLWRTLEPKLGPGLKASARRWGWFWQPRQWAAGAGLTILLIGAFLAGRHSMREQPPVPAAVEAPGYDERVLLTAVGNHLDRSQMILVELANAQPETPPQLEDVEDLLDANRLYRTSAQQAGEPQLADVLDELERLLVEVAHLAPRLTPQAGGELRERILEKGILLKLRVAGSEVRERERMKEGTRL